MTVDTTLTKWNVGGHFRFNVPVRLECPPLFCVRQMSTMMHRDLGGDERADEPRARLGRAEPPVADLAREDLRARRDAVRVAAVGTSAATVRRAIRKTNGSKKQSAKTVNSHKTHPHKTTTHTHPQQSRTHNIHTKQSPTKQPHAKHPHTKQPHTNQPPNHQQNPSYAS